MVQVSPELSTQISKLPPTTGVGTTVGVGVGVGLGDAVGLGVGAVVGVGVGVGSSELLEEPPHAARLSAALASTPLKNRDFINST